MSPTRSRVSALCAPLALALAPSALAAGRAPHIDAATAKSCDYVLGTQTCLAPFPNDYFTVADKHTATGRRVHFAPNAMPANGAGTHIDPTPWNRNDGFSPGISIIARIPGLDTQQAFDRTGLVPITDMARYADQRQPVVVIDAKTGKRAPIWAEVDSLAPTEADRNLLVRPAKNY